MTDEQHEQNGCGNANIAPNNVPVKPPRVQYSFRYMGRIDSVRPEMRIPSMVACQTLSR